MRQNPAHKIFTIKKEWIIYIGIVIVTVLVNVIAWNSTAFCDAYIAYIFPLWVNTYGRFTGMFPFSVGEWMLVAAVMVVAVAIVVGILWTKHSFWKRAAENYYHFLAWLVLVVCVIMTLNCFILYHASAFSEKYFEEDTREYTIEDVLRIYNYVAAQCNELSGKVVRDGEGTIIYSGVNQAGEPVDMKDKAIEVMQHLGKTYPQLDGYYPRPKAMMFSDFMCQQYMCGYYFPFSMEANYNDVMYIMNKPATMCHELAHLRGYIFEDEANFISFLACVESDDVTFQYAGYLSVLNYLINDLYKAAQTSPVAYDAAVTARTPVSVADIVQQDNVFVTESEWERINGKALLDTETVEEMSDTFTDTTLKLNGVEDGIVSYSRVVRLLLQYYKGKF